MARERGKEGGGSKGRWENGGVGSKGFKRKVREGNEKV